MSLQAPLDTQQVEVRLGKLDNKTSDKLAVQGTLNKAQNCEQNITGKFTRRSGTTLLDTITGAIRLHGGERETIVGTLDTLYSNVDGVFSARGSIAGYQGDFEPVNNSAFTQVAHDMVRADGLDWSVWEEPSGIFYAARDSTNGAYVVSEGVITTAGGRTAPLIVAAGTFVAVFYLSGGNIVCRRITTAVPATVGAEVVVTGLSFGQGYDVVLKSGTTVAVATHTLSGTAFVSLVEFDINTGAVTASRTQNLAFTAAGAKYSVSFMRNTGSYVVLSAVSDNGAVGSNIKVVTAPFGLASTTLVTIFGGGAGTVHSITNCTGFVDGIGTWHMLIDATLTTASARSQVWYFTRTSGGSLAGPLILFGFRLMSQTFSFGGVDLVMYSGTVQSLAGPDSTYFLAEVKTGAIVGRALAGLADERTNDASGNVRNGWLPHPTVSAAQALIPSVYFLTTTQRSAAIVSFDMQPLARYLEVAGVTLVPGSTIHLYDGVGVSELGFHFPPGITAVATAATGGLQVGDYWYRACWEWVDARGRLHRSSPSEPTKLTSAGAGLRGRVTVGSLVMTLKSSPIPQAVLALFRSTINPSSSSAAAYFRCATVANDPSTAALVIDDTLTDAQLIVNDRLYTLGNTVLSNASPPPANGLEAWGDRVWAWERDLLWYSKTLQDGEGVAFPAESFIQISDDQGDIVSAANAGQRLVVFKSRAMYVITGDGPDDRGIGSFSPTRRLPAPLGARSAVSVISTELGVFFQDDASGHIWLVPADGDPQPIGREVETLSTGLTISDAVVVSSKRQVRFFSKEGTTLVYDLTHQCWYQWTNQPANAAALVGGVCHYITNDNVGTGVTAGQLMMDDATAWREANGVTYAMVLETDWVATNQIGGYQRLFAGQVAGEKRGTFTGVFTMTFRYGTAFATRFESSASVGTAYAFRVEFRPKINQQQATAVRVTVNDGGPNADSFGVEAISLTVGVRGKRERVPRAHVAT